jgi:predicted transcriptional regulator
MKVLSDIGLPVCIGVALSNEAKAIILADWDGDVPEEDRNLEQQLMVDLKKSLSDAQLELVTALQDVMLKQSLFIKEFMFYSGVRQGIRFYKDYQSI